MADTARFSVSGNDIIDTATGKPVTPDEFNKTSTPEEKNLILRELTARGRMVNQESENQIDEGSVDEDLAGGPLPEAEATSSEAPWRQTNLDPVPQQPAPTPAERTPQQAERTAPVARPDGAPPSLKEFLTAARPANPEFDDRELAIEYRKAYPDANKFYPPPPIDQWLPKAKESNPQFDDTELKSMYEDIYGKPEIRADHGDVVRGFVESVKQIPQLAAGLAAGAGAAGEKLFGEGGGATALKKFGVENYQRIEADLAKDTKLTDSFNYSFERAKQGDYGALVDWLQHGFGYVGGQAIQLLATGVAGGAAGKASLQYTAESVAQKMIAKESAALAAQTGGKLAGEELTKLAVANVAKNMGQTLAVGAAATGMEGGEIFGELTSEAAKQGRQLSGAELAKAGVMTAFAGALEFVGDKIGLDLILGKSPITKMLAPKSGVGGRLLRGAEAGAIAAVPEAATEFGQTVVEEWGKGHDPIGSVSPETLRQAEDAAAIGALGGAMVGGTAGVLRPGGEKEPPGETAPKSPMDTVAPVLGATSVDEAISTATKITETAPITASQLDQAIGSTKPDAYTDSHLAADQTAISTAFQTLGQAGAGDFTVDAQTGAPMYEGAPIKVVDPRTLPATAPPDAGMSQEKLDAFSVIAQAFGKRVVVFESHANLPNGMYWQSQDPTRVYVSRTTTGEDLATTLRHELMHTMQGTPLYEAYKQTIVENKADTYQKYIEKKHQTAGERTLTDSQLLEEAAADIGSVELQKQDMWEKVFRRLREQVGDEQAKVEVTSFIDSLKQIVQRIKGLISTRNLTVQGKTLTELYVKDIEKVQDALVEAVAKTLYDRKYATPEQARAVGKLALSQRPKETRAIIPRDVSEAFSALASQQREKPEAAMLAVQRALGGGVLAPAVEHTGDLIHRMTEGAKYGAAGKEIVREKVNKVINYLTHAYGFEKEHAENLANNAAYYEKSVEEYRKPVEDALGRYVAEHKALPVYNRAQWLARAAAVAVGEMRIKDAVAHLKDLKKMVESADFSKEAFSFRRGADQTVEPYLEPIPGKLIGIQKTGSLKIPDFALYNLDVDTPNHPAGSTVSDTTMREEGYQIVPSDLVQEGGEDRPALSPQVDLRESPEERRTLSTTVPRSKRSSNDAYTQHWVVGTDDIRASKSHLNALVAAIKSYTMMSGKGGKEAALAEFRQKAIDNLLWLYDLVPPKVRDRAKRWYEGANRIASEWSAQDGYTDKQHAGVLAVLSPQKDWFMNVSLADRVRTIMKEHAASPWSPAMSAWASSTRASAKTNETIAIADKFVDAAVRLEGVTLDSMSDADAALFIRAYDQTYHERAYRTVTPEGEFTDYVINKQEVDRDLFGDIPGVRGTVAWGAQSTIEKAVSILRDGSNKNITEKLGNEHKVRNFYNNILDPQSTEGHVTIDTHAMAAAVMKAISANAKEVTDLFGRAGSNAETGASGSYGLIADIYREAAQKRGVLPRELQSVTWEAVRGLFPREQKKVLGPKVDAIWAQVKKGALTADQARARIFAISGGISPFAWEKYDMGLSPADGGRSFDSKPSTGAVVNIGLNVNDGSTITAQAALSALKLAGANVLSHSVRTSNTEPTLIAELVAPLSPEKAHGVSVALKQDAIAQRLPDGSGELYGPAADKWGPFNPEYFLSPGGEPQLSPRAGVAQLVHYSKEKGLTEISPKFHGTGQIGAERMRQMNEGKAYIPRSFFYRAKTKIEPRFKGMAKYQVEVPESSLVDLATLTGTPTERERTAKKAGYKGYYNSESSMPNVVAMFESVPTTSGQAPTAAVGDLRSDPLFSPRTWVSQIEKVLEQKMPKSASATQIRGILSPQNGIKQDELQEMGIDEYLASKDKFDKHNVMEWVRAHQIQAEQVTFEKKTRELTPREIDGIKRKYEPAIAQLTAEFELLEKAKAEVEEKIQTGEIGERLYDSVLASWRSARTKLDRGIVERDEELKRRSVEEDSTKYASWQLPGGENYKEVFVTLPAPKLPMVELTNWRAEKMYGEDYNAWDVRADRPNGTQFVSHIDIEESPTEAEAIRAAQWIAERHASNYATNWALIENQTETDRAGELIYDVVDPNGRVRATLPHYDAAEYVQRESDLAAKDWRDGHEQYDDVINPIVRLRMNDRTTVDGKKILFLEEVQPPNPSNQEKMPKWALKRWREIGLKQALRIAADGNYDAIGWTTGAQQADRYSLRKHVNRLTILLGDKNENGESTYEVRAHTPDQNLVTRVVPKSELPGVIGEALAARAISEIPKSDFAMVTYKDLDLATGGEGLMKVYDQDLVNAANGIAKKWGVKAGTMAIAPDPGSLAATVPMIDLDTNEEVPMEGVPVHTLPVTDAMKTVVKEGLPLFAPKPKQPKPAPTFQVEQPGALDKIIRLFQDKSIDIKRIVEGVQKAGRALPDELNPVLKEEMYMKRAEQRASDYTNDELRPLVKAMQLAKVSLDQLDRYLQARHIIRDKVNARLQAINPDLQGTPEYDRLGGMSDKEAHAILANANQRIMEPLAKRVDAMVEKTRDLMVAYGLEKQTTIDSWRQFYSAYVPLHREGFEEEGHPTGTGRSVRGSTVKGRTGSGLAATNILANVAQARDQIITRGEKQRPVIAMAGLLMLHPNPEIATLDKPAQIEMTDPVTGLIRTVPGNLTNYTVPTIRRYDPVDQVVKTYPDPTYKGRDNVVNFRIDGQDYAIVFNERNERAMEAAKAFKELDTAKLNGIMAAVAPYTRYLASINTQYNPIFGIVNFVRDAQFAMLALASTPLAGQKAEVLKHAVGALKGIYQDARAVRLGLHPTSSTARMWERFQHVGGPTGYRDLFFSSTDRASEIERMLEPNNLALITGPQALGKRLEETWLLQTLSDYNTTMENSIRLGVFITGVQQGMSDIQAASYAKNITVNFNKKGQIGAQMGSLYAFFNANVQGTARIFETVFERTPGGVRLSAAGRKIVVGGLLAGILQTFALSLAGFGDDEPPEYIKARNLVIPVPGTDKGYALIPMPLGFNLLPNIGRAAAEAMRAGIEGRDINPMRRFSDLVGALYGTFSPLGGTGGPIQEMMPTVADPIAAVVSNRDWTGKTISKEDMSTLDPTPGHTRVKDTASHWAMFLAKAINWATGGSDYTPGALSPTPDMIDYLVEQITGGIGREVTKGAQVLKSVTTGEELPFYKIPLAGRFAGSATGSTAIRSDFYDNVKKVNLAYREFEGRAKDRTGDAHEYLRAHPEGRLREAAISIERTIGELQKNKKELIEKGAPRSAVRLREEQITGLMSRFNAMVDRQTPGRK